MTSLIAEKTLEVIGEATMRLQFPREDGPTDEFLEEELYHYAVSSTKQACGMVLQKRIASGKEDPSKYPAACRSVGAYVTLQASSHAPLLLTPNVPLHTLPPPLIIVQSLFGPHFVRRLDLLQALTGNPCMPPVTQNAETHPEPLPPTSQSSNPTSSSISHAHPNPTPHLPSTSQVPSSTHQASTPMYTPSQQPTQTVAYPCQPTQDVYSASQIPADPASYGHRTYHNSPALYAQQANSVPPNKPTHQALASTVDSCKSSLHKPAAHSCGASFAFPFQHGDSTKIHTNRSNNKDIVSAPSGTTSGARFDFPF
mmetsp:Transcript_36290/g.50405  ORF Transcript_36290/g.50405 Transcript_36290/m.50405 type:complete len:312 (-) Transcript_36290:175-1110(-)|eukprot:CAMPEP_0196592740 /NCGR_PEP_ID=MMETSP1081-20130531/73654_1 /TAXON_ID=36882 /ORGANISM="Pyramimonas amylifera, Strain CCMP720" /LENGTH=311 /DNA_ID=CAMNT_0041916515 /DNA_START=350 /DNA_END=1285 /DNA_ORIENTATION=-